MKKETSKLLLATAIGGIAGIAVRHIFFSNLKESSYDFIFALLGGAAGYSIYKSHHIKHIETRIAEDIKLYDDNARYVVYVYSPYYSQLMLWSMFEASAENDEKNFVKWLDYCSRHDFEPSVKKELYENIKYIQDEKIKFSIEDFKSEFRMANSIITIKENKYAKYKDYIFYFLCGKPNVNNINDLKSENARISAPYFVIRKVKREKFINESILRFLPKRAVLSASISANVLAGIGVGGEGSYGIGLAVDSYGNLALFNCFTAFAGLAYSGVSVLKSSGNHWLGIILAAGVSVDWSIDFNWDLGNLENFMGTAYTSEFFSFLNINNNHNPNKVVGLGVNTPVKGASFSVVNVYEYQTKGIIISPEYDLEMITDAWERLNNQIPNAYKSSKKTYSYYMENETLFLGCSVKTPLSTKHYKTSTYLEVMEENDYYITVNAKRKYGEKGLSD